MNTYQPRGPWCRPWCQPLCARWGILAVVRGDGYRWKGFWGSSSLDSRGRKRKWTWAGRAGEPHQSCAPLAVRITYYARSGGFCSAARFCLVVSRARRWGGSRASVTLRIAVTFRRAGRPPAVIALDAQPSSFHSSLLPLPMQLAQTSSRRAFVVESHQAFEAPSATSCSFRSLTLSDIHLVLRTYTPLCALLSE
ncbi:hypothetical protein BO70DRAFT_54247 [Aspergillus heteromorphus CBS 117.55]|uniref:Uncharacterized protein n=1 Tax=Aspergillus heteromorphus CBS 117.55 TaxID=1448321 RepID=A0A317VZF0_9EURO|nr:uncharacterized protein BO70DRAFT_54247 [Aspergillus heteromorphus CBS 117.55]PWY79736.1 hypothetical protein BO70DRAFT_54247 [Aspergillus heteromorphus CBS 117.55]